MIKGVTSAQRLLSLILICAAVFVCGPKCKQVLVSSPCKLSVAARTVPGPVFNAAGVGICRASHVSDAGVIEQLGLQGLPVSSCASVSGAAHAHFLYRRHVPDGYAFLPIDLLTDEVSAIEHFGESPFVLTRHGLRYKMVGEGFKEMTFVGESHKDQCLALMALTEIERSYPIRAFGGVYSLDSLLAETIASFRMQQPELPWSAIAISRFLPPLSKWKNRFGDEFDLDMLSAGLLEVDLSKQSCGGLHVLQALAFVSRNVESRLLISSEMLTKIDARLCDFAARLKDRQSPDGYWTDKWHASNSFGRIVDTEGANAALMATGHIIELSAIAGDIDFGDLEAASNWLEQTIATQANGSAFDVCPLTHALKGVCLCNP